MTYFTADQHFGHFNIIRLSHRPFASLDEMNEAMIAKWNAKVKPGDAVPGKYNIVLKLPEGATSGFYRLEW